MPVSLRISNQDIRQAESDIVILKYATEWRGADLAVFEELSSAGLLATDIRVLPGQTLLVNTERKLPAKEVLFIGTQDLYSLGYPEIRALAVAAISLTSRLPSKPSSLAMTLHGPGYGLDESEAFAAILGGFIETLADFRDIGIERITIHELDHKRHDRLVAFASEWLDSKETSGILAFDRASTPGADVRSGVLSTDPDILVTAGITSNLKKRAFVAMPFSPDFDDLYALGIEPTVKRQQGWLCGRVDKVPFTGDVLMQIKNQISDADLVVADMTGANPNVYLEVGFAWGAEKPVILIAKESEPLKFDVQGQKCLFYRNIQHLMEMLEVEITGLGI